MLMYLRIVILCFVILYQFSELLLTDKGLCQWFLYVKHMF